MKNLLLSGLCCAGLLALLPETGRAHGGQYRGPGDVVPPTPGGGGGGGASTGGPSGPSTGGPAGPSAPSPSGPGPSTGGGPGPSTGGPGGPGGGGGGATTGGGGVQVTEDLTEWKFWWEFNKDPYIRLRDAVLQGGPQTGSDDFFLGSTRRSEARNSLRPTEEQILGKILPALKKAIDTSEQRDINSSCMVAMAKIGTNHPDFKLIDVFKPRLAKPDLEISETAALSIGIAAIAEEEAVELLTGLALDTAKGREACRSSTVNNRVRSFAIYGLGLLANKHSQTEIKAKAFEVMKKVLEADEIRQLDPKVAAINGMSILNVGSESEQDKLLLDEVLKCLEGYYMKSLGAGQQLIQAHVPTAIAKLIGPDHQESDRFKELFASDLGEKGKVKRVSNDIFRSCAMALGMMARPHDDKDDKKNPDNKYSKLLHDTYRNHKDLQTRSFALLALGQIGGDLNREILLKEFDKGGKNQEKTWASLALGVYAFHKYEKQREIVPETTIAQTLFDTLKQAKDPSLVGALAIGLGLCRATEAADHMRGLMIGNIAKEEMAGYLCIGLALMNDVRSKEDMRNVVTQWTRRDQLLQQAAIALGKLGDKGVAEVLLKLMSAEGESNLAKLSAIASALGFIGDQRSIDPLKDMLFNTKLHDLARAFAAVALGGVADKEMLPWNSKIGVNLNYRAAVETLTNRQSGILDIL
ncbi:MAG: HEAT repeat domain-containing protein [Planctomycetes bacterium]|nr:HEAT repeat domain-containing protein [Planctomycetota bacterium]